MKEKVFEITYRDCTRKEVVIIYAFDEDDAIAKFKAKHIRKGDNIRIETIIVQGYVW